MALFIKRATHLFISQQLIFPVLTVAATLIWNYFIGDLSWDIFKVNIWKSIFPAIAVAGVISAVLIVFSARDLNKEIADSVTSRVSLIILPSSTSPIVKRPSRMPGLVNGALFLAFVCILEYLAFRAAYPTIPPPPLISSPPKYPTQLGSLEKPNSTIRARIPAATTMPPSDLGHLPTSISKEMELRGVQGRADLKLEFYGKEKLQYMYFADSTESASQPKRYFGLWDITRPYHYEKYPGVVQPLPLTVKSEMDFVFHGERQGPNDVLDNSAATAHVKPGDRLFGIAFVMCFNCEKHRSYWIYFEAGKGGWYAEMEKPVFGETIQVPATNSTDEQLAEVLELQVPLGRRIPISEQYQRRLTREE